MRSIKPLTLLILLFLNKSIFSQMEFPVFGSFSTEEIAMKQCSFDPEADAVVLLDKAFSNYDDSYRLITERRIRIKILSQKGVERADIAIPFYSKDDYEFLSKLEAYTYNFDERGIATSTAVGKKSFYTEKTNAYWSQMKFAMPAVKVGSIIEYHYVSTMKNYGGLEEWRFQTDMPTIQSGYLLQIVPNAEFAYTIQKFNRYPITVRPMPNDGRIYFEMNNVAGLRIEPYMDAPRDYLQKVIFQFSGYLSGGRQKVNTTWKELAYSLMTEKTYGSQLDKDLKIDAIKPIVANETTATGKLKVIYEYVKKNITWNGFESKYAIDGLKSVWDKKKGASGEINLLLVNLLKSADIVAYPILAAERDFGKIDTTYPFIDRFNKTVVFAVADGKQYVLDATQENCPLGLTPYPLLGTSAFLVDKKSFNLIRIASGSKFYKEIITVKGELDTRGLLTSEAKVQSYDYARQSALDQIKSNKSKFISSNFEKPYEGLTIDSFLITPPENDTMAVEQVVRFKQQLNQSSGFTFLNPNFFTGLEKNPFISSIRFTNVNFGYPYNIMLQERFKVPAGTRIELPQDKSLRSDDKTIEAFRQVRFENGEINVTLKFVQITTLVSAENYPGIKDFYKKLIDMLNEPIAITIKN